MEETKKSLIGKSGIEQKLIVSEWLRSIMEAETFEKAMSIVEGIYQSGHSDGYYCGTGDNSWDK
jgi:hypothetical protein